VASTASTSYDDSDPASNPLNTYQYRVASCDSIECGAYSTPSPQVTFSTAPAC
jgi:hypothetical protein